MFSFFLSYAFVTVNSQEAADNAIQEVEIFDSHVLMSEPPEESVTAGTVRYCVTGHSEGTGVKTWLRANNQY